MVVVAELIDWLGYGHFQHNIASLTGGGWGVERLTICLTECFLRLKQRFQALNWIFAAYTQGH